MRACACAGAGAVQAVYLAYPGTHGASYLDYNIGTPTRQHARTPARPHADARTHMRTNVHMHMNACARGVCTRMRKRMHARARLYVRTHVRKQPARTRTHAHACARTGA